MFYKQCTKCDEWKLSDQFPKGHNRCIACRDAYMKTWADTNREKINKNQLKYQTTIVGRASVLLNAALKRAKSKNEDFRLTHKDVIQGIQQGFCSRTKLPFDMELKSRGTNVYHINPLSPSIDKINAKGIYEPDNVQYVCSWYNLAKGQMTDEDLIGFCKKVASINE